MTTHIQKAWSGDFWLRLRFYKLWHRPVGGLQKTKLLQAWFRIEMGNFDLNEMLQTWYRVERVNIDLNEVVSSLIQNWKGELLVTSLIQGWEGTSDLKEVVKSLIGEATDLSFPKIGERPMMTEASADLTCWLASETRSFTQGRMLVIITLSRTSGDKFWQKSVKQGHIISMLTNNFQTFNLSVETSL